MSSRDGSGQPGSKWRSANANTSPGSSKPQGGFDIDPAEIDRYLSGQPQRAPERQPRPAAAGSQSNADQLNRLRRLVATEDDFSSPAPQRQQAPSVTYREATPPPAKRAPATRRSAPASTYDDVYLEDDYVYEDARTTDYLDEYPGQWDEEGDPALAGQSARRVRSRPTMPNVTIPRAITSAAILTDRMALSLIAIGVVSLIGMAVLVSNRIDTLPAQIGTHVSASGVLGNFASRDVIWRIPLLALMLTLMNIVIGVFAARFDRFASRLVLASALMIQFLAWVALLRIL
ncbi:MAG: hypothetical protein WBA46_03390 [Thermomicrobiales bacterium]